MDARILAKNLIGKSLIADELAQKLIMESQTTGQSFEEIIFLRRLIDDEKIAHAKSEILGIPYMKANPSSIPVEVFKIIPENTARSYKFVPLGISQSKMLIVGMTDPDNNQAQEALRFIAKQNRLNMGIYVITPTDLDMVLRRYNPYEREVQAAVQSLKLKPAAGSSKTVSLDEDRSGKASSEEAPIIHIVSSTLKEATAQNASDIHIEPERTRMRIRFRIDGALKEVAVFPSEILSSIVARIKILSNLKIDETRMPQDGRFSTNIFGRDIDYRVATFPTPLGEKIVLRVLDPSAGLKGMESLGLMGQNSAWVKEGLDKPFGMVLVTGPTGSGKTTTLYAFLKDLNTEDVNILSMEDPVEYFMDGVNQSQVKPEIGYTFAAGLRQALRQDPDIILVGEIRDNETADLAVQAALTGHVVLSTLHTNNAAGVVPRLLDMGVAPFLLPSALTIMLAQRLVRKLCDKCRKPEDPTPEIMAIIKEELGKMSQEARSLIEIKEPYKIWHALGCDNCKGKGEVGRIAIYEVMKMSRNLAEIIESGPTEAKLNDESARQGMVTLRQDGIIKALLGLVAMEEVLKETAKS